MELEGIVPSVDDNDEVGGFRCKLSTDEILFLGFNASEDCEAFDIAPLSNKDSRLFFHTWGLKSFETMLARFNVTSSSDVNDISLFSEDSENQKLLMKIAKLILFEIKSFIYIYHCKIIIPVKLDGK